MQIFHNMDEWRHVRRELPAHLSLGFVPTMGNLHIGHASLFTASQRDNDRTVASIFINPTQFNAESDFEHYPRTLEADLAILEQTGVDYCLLPNVQNMYTDGYRYQITENTRSLLLEGQHRPGHYTGVLTIVLKLFNIAQPHRSYFGEKDFQQYQLIRDMTHAFMLDIEVKMCPTVRESSGLAYSSRNNRLNPAQKHLAERFARLFHQRNKSCEQIRKELELLEIGIDYIEEHEGRRFAAIHIDAIRLIDNYLL